MGWSMTSSVTDIVLSPTVTSFSNSWKLIQSTGKDLSDFVSGEAMASSVSKLIAYLFIQNCFKCYYNHYSIVAFGNTRLTL